MASPLNVLFLAAEAVPFIQVTELADFAGNFTKAISAFDEIDIRLVLPFYDALVTENINILPIAEFSVPYEEGAVEAEAFLTRIEHTTVYLIRGGPISEVKPVYTADGAADAEKFIFFSLATLALLVEVDFIPDIIHANDWHTCSAIYGSRLHRDFQAKFQKTATLLGVNNLKYLGGEAFLSLQSYNLPPANDCRLPWWARDMLLPLGLSTADHIVLPSSAHGRDILSSEYSAGLHDFFKTRFGAISGINPGIDAQVWNPAHDTCLAAPYDQSSLSMRTQNKIALQTDFNLDIDSGIPLVGIVSQQDKHQVTSNLPLVFRAIDDLPWQAIFLGNINPKGDNKFRQLEGEYPTRVRTPLETDECLTRRFYAGGDAIIFSSQNDTSGQAQMISLRYGCVPVSNSSGGSRDAIIDFQTSPLGTGFLFPSGSVEGMITSVQAMLEAYHQPDTWSAIQQRGMQMDFSIQRSARQFIERYQLIVKARKIVSPDVIL